MKIIIGTVDYTKPGIYWDGVQGWFVDVSGVGWGLGSTLESLKFVEEDDGGAQGTPADGGATVGEKVALLDAAARLLAAGK